MYGSKISNGIMAASAAASMKRNRSTRASNEKAQRQRHRRTACYDSMAKMA